MNVLGMSFFNSQPMNDIDLGRDAIKYFHNEMVKYDTYKMTMTELIDAISISPTGVSHGDIFLDGLGTAITSINMTESQISDAMVKLADASGGQIPNGMSPFFKALSDRMQDLTASDWAAALPGIAADTALTAVKGVQAIGDSVIATGKTLTMIGPAVVVAAVLFIVYAKARQIGGR